MSRITEKRFFANVLSFKCVPISQRPLQRVRNESILYYYNLYWFFHLHRWDVLNSCITLRAERINVNPVFFPHYEFCKSLAHTFILYISEHTFKNAIVHSCSNGLHQFHYLIPNFRFSSGAFDLGISISR